MVNAKPKKAKAIALLSGGLDSTLAILVLLKQNVDVTAITFLNHFGCDISDSSSCARDPFPASEKYGFTVKLNHLADKFMDIVINPKFGHGKNMNPCIDCRILMLKEAKQFMRMSGADFLVTGEVLGQRPMSQRRDSFPVIDREADVKGLVLRPLSAKRLEPTRAELTGLVDREKLYGFVGRSRKPQMKLADELDLTDYPSPAGGCLLTDPIYSDRLRDLLTYNEAPDMREINLLRVGRHFRISEKTKIIIGRNQAENEALESLVMPDDLALEAQDCGSPLTLVIGEQTSEIAELAASMTARYSSAKTNPLVRVLASKNDKPESELNVEPISDEFLAGYRIDESSKKENKKTAKQKKIPSGISSRASNQTSTPLENH